MFSCEGLKNCLMESPTILGWIDFDKVTPPTKKIKPICVICKCTIKNGVQFATTHWICNECNDDHR